MNSNNVLELTKILEDALCGDTVRRQKAEADITQLAEANFNLFLLSLSMKISNESEPKPIRQISATIIKNMITNPSYTPKWYALLPEQKNTIKKYILSTLASSDSDIRKAAGLSIAGICKVELPRKEWVEIFEILRGTSINNDISIQLSSIITLGYIIQEISNEDLNEMEVAKLLDCFYNLLNKQVIQEELVYQTLLSVESLLSFITSLVKEKEKRELFFNMIRKFTTHQSSKIRNISLQIFIDIVRMYYDYLGEYYKSLIEFTTVIIAKDEVQNALLAYEIWISIGTIESDRLEKKQLPYHQICEQTYNTLLPLIYNNLVSDKYDCDEWTMQKAASYLLALLSKCCNYGLVQNVINYIGPNIENMNVNLKYSALLAFCAILETVHHSTFSGIVKKSIDLIINCIINQSEEPIKDMAALILERITKYYGKYIIEDGPLFHKLFQLFESSLMKYKRKIGIRLINGLNNLVKVVDYNSNQNTNILSGYMNDILIQLLTLAFTKNAYNSEYNLAVGSFFLIGALVEKGAKDVHVILVNFFNNVVSSYQSTMDSSKYPNEEMQMNYQGYISTILSSFIIVCNFDNQTLINLYYIVIETFKQKNRIYSEGLMLVGGIVNQLGESFSNRIDEFMPYLYKGLESFKEAELLKSSITALCSFIYALKDKISQVHVDRIIGIVFHILSDGDINKSVKPIAFNVLSDLIYSNPTTVSPYYNQIMEMLSVALEAAMTTPKYMDDIDIYYYIINLREHIIESITCVFYSDPNSTNTFISFLPQLMAFINKINRKDENPSFTLAKDSLGLIGDLCARYGKEMKKYINTEIIKEMIEMMKKIPEVENRSLIEEMVKYTEKNVTNVLSYN